MSKANVHLGVETVKCKRSSKKTIFMNLNIKPFGDTILKIVIFAFLVLMFFLSSTFLCYNFLMGNYLQKQVAQSK